MPHKYVCSNLSAWTAVVSAAKYNHMSPRDILRSVGWKAAPVLVPDFISRGAHV